MDNKNFNQILEKLNKISEIMHKKQANSLELDLLKRIIIRLQSFDCNECKNYLSDIEIYLNYFNDNIDFIEKQKLKEYRKTLGNIKNHLQKEHGLYPEGTYTSTYMSIGMSIGLVFGLTVFDNIALGLPIGLGIGLAIGSGIDADLKKKGKII